MKIILLLITILLIMNGCASSRWVKAGNNEVGTYYVDKKTIRKNSYGKVITMEMADYKVAQKEGDIVYKSISGQFEYDCAQEKRRLRHVTAYSGNMGEGNKIGAGITKSINQWSSVTPGSIDESILISVCYNNPEAENKAAKRQKFNDLLLMNIYYNQLFR